jgi:hypothetical protein
MTTFTSITSRAGPAGAATVMVTCMRRGVCRAVLPSSHTKTLRNMTIRCGHRSASGSQRSKSVTTRYLRPLGRPHPWTSSNETCHAAAGRGPGNLPGTREAPGQDDELFRAIIPGEQLDDDPRQVLGGCRGDSRQPRRGEKRQDKEQVPHDPPPRAWAIASAPLPNTEAMASHDRTGGRTGAHLPMERDQVNTFRWRQR